MCIQIYKVTIIGTERGIGELISSFREVCLQSLCSNCFGNGTNKRLSRVIGKITLLIMLSSYTDVQPLNEKENSESKPWNNYINAQMADKNGLWRAMIDQVLE